MTEIPSPPPPAPPSSGPPGGDWSASAPPPPPARPVLRRSRTDKVLGGVCGGLAEYTGIDPLLWRVGAIALTVAGGSGVLVYVLLWLLLPSAPRDGGPVRASRLSAGRSAPAGPRSPVPGITVAVLLVLAGIAVLISHVTSWGLSARVVFATALLVVGGGLVAAGLRGAGRRAIGGLIALGVFLGLGLIASSTGHHGGPPGHVGDRTYRPASAADVRPSYSGGVGDVTVDLRQVDFAGQTTPVVTRIDTGIGDVDVTVPRDADVQVDIDPGGIGDVRVFGEKGVSGFFPGTGNASFTDDGRPELRLSVHAGIGDVEVHRG